VTLESAGNVEATEAGAKNYDVLRHV
jgi:hypothetical protein